MIKIICKDGIAYHTQVIDTETGKEIDGKFTKAEIKIDIKNPVIKLVLTSILPAIDIECLPENVTIVTKNKQGKFRDLINRVMNESW